MKVKVSLVVGLALMLVALVIAMSQAQGPDDGEETDVQTPPVPSRSDGSGSLPTPRPHVPFSPDPVGSGEAGMGPLGSLAVAETVTSTFSYQGVLKENGQTVTGNRDMIFRLYNDAVCTSIVGSPMTYTVLVDGGLFDVDLLVNQTDVNGEALWLETEVGGTSVGCQPIQAAPYALSLRPGAVISGTPAIADGLVNAQYGTGSQAREGLIGGKMVVNAILFGAGVYGYADTTFAPGVGVWGWGRSPGATGVLGWAGAVTSTNYGVYAASSSPDGYAGYFDNDGGGVDIAAGGSGIISSVAENKIAASPFSAVPHSLSVSDLEIRTNAAGYVEIRPLAVSSNENVYVPVDLPLQLFGVQQKLRSVQICYRVENASSYITQVNVRTFEDDGGYTTPIHDITARTSTTFACYTLTDANPDLITGSLLIHFQLVFADTGYSNDIQIGKITLTLVE